MNVSSNITRNDQISMNYSGVLRIDNPVVAILRLNVDLLGLVIITLLLG